MTTFADLGVRPELTAVLQSQGITEPFAIQALTVRDSLAGRDVCGKARTGSGKSLAFAIPIVQRTEPEAASQRPRALILAPTRELAGQLLSVIGPLAEAVGSRAHAVYGGRSLDRDVAVLRRGVEILVATPGRLIDLLERDAVRLDDIGLVVIDEADRMADMGFLPQVEWVLRRLHGRRPQMLLFSATLDGEIDGLVRRYLSDPVRHEVAAEEQTVEEMEHCFLAVHQMDRVKVVGSIAAGAFRTMVFVRTKRGADRLAGQLAKEGVHAAAIHGDLRQTARERALRDFTAGKLAVLVATDVAARGIHIDDVDVVIHFDPPEDHKAYLHRSGRTARAGQAGVVVTFVLWNQVPEVERVQKRLGLEQVITEVFSNDPRLADLSSLTGGASRRAAS